jgi:two-component system cell cycle sensor histidine kinase/response regulator CckA
MSDPTEAVMPDSRDSSLPFQPTGLRLLADLDGIAWRRELAVDGTITYPWLSDNCDTLLGYAPDQMTVGSKGELNIVHWADRESHMMAVSTSARHLTPCDEQFRAITAAGETRWLRGSSRPRRLSDGRIVWDGLWLDNTLRMRAEVQHQMLMDHADDCILILSGSDCITWSNAAAERNFGYLAEELIGRCFTELIGQSDSHPCSCAPERSADLFHDSNREVTAHRRDGTTFPFEMTVSEVRSDGKLSLIVIGRDITQRRIAELRLEDSEKRLRLAFAAASLGIVVVALDGAIQFYNPAFESMADESCETLLGHCLYALVPSDKMPPLSRLPPSGISFCLFCQPTLTNGEEHHWRITGTQFSLSPDAVEPSLLLFIEDVTETTRIAQERRQLELTLSEGQKLEALGRLAGGIAHELNNMLGPILMGAEMVERTATLDLRNIERIQRVIDAAKHSRDIVRNVLAYSRKEQKTFGPIDLVPVFDSFVSLACSTLPPSIKVEIHRDIEHAVVIADGGQIQQILLNLANNARDAMSGIGTLSLTIDRLLPLELLTLHRHMEAVAETKTPLSTLDLGREHVEIRVSDTGTGMSRATIAKIFDPFFTTKPVGQGTGLGLSVVQGIITSMSGAICVDSKIGSGTLFHVILPLLDSQPPPE